MGLHAAVNPDPCCQVTGVLPGYTIGLVPLPEPAGCRRKSGQDLVVSKSRGPQYRFLYIYIYTYHVLIIGTPKMVTLILGNPYLSKMYQVRHLPH